MGCAPNAMGGSGSSITFGTALSFVDTGYIDVANLLPVSLASDWSLSFWLYNRGASGVFNPYILNFVSNDETDEISSQLSSGDYDDLNAFLRVSNSFQNGSSAGRVPRNQWSHLTYSYAAGSTLKIYVNAVERISVSRTGNPDGARDFAYFGRRWDVEDNDWRNGGLYGYVTDWQFYNSSSSSIPTDTYNSGSLGGVSSNPVCRLIDSGVDISGNGNDQTLNNISTASFTPF